MIEIFILSFVQGVAEFIPVSSSSHLILISNLLDFENQSLTIDVSLHIGSLLAVLIYFYKDIINFIENKNLFFNLGPENKWEKILDKKTKEIIETNFKNEMKELKYL